MKKRYLENCIVQDLSEKMVFIGGPRQVGKTTLATGIAQEHFHPYNYLNWDNRDDRAAIMKDVSKSNTRLVIFDEIHKYQDWKNYIKGLYDTNKDKFKILVTGSARLDVYRRGGDSMMGRYHYYRLHPFSVAEVLRRNNHTTVHKELSFADSDHASQEAFAILTKFGGFPEPLIRQSQRIMRRWHNERTDRLVRDDIRDMQNIRELSLMQLLVDTLPGKVGSLLSLNSLREDLQVAYKTVAAWMDILERFYYCFRVYPFHHSRVRSLKKEPKLYLWDWSEVPTKPPLLENMVASHLLKFCHFLKDWEGYRMNLYYIRDTSGREVDFLVAEKDTPWFAVEVRSADVEPSGNLRYFGQRMNIPFLYQVVLNKDVDQVQDSVRVMSLDKFLAALM